MVFNIILIYRGSIELLISTRNKNIYSIRQCNINRKYNYKYKSYNIIFKFIFNILSQFSSNYIGWINKYDDKLNEFEISIVNGGFCYFLSADEKNKTTSEYIYYYDSYDDNDYVLIHKNHSKIRKGDYWNSFFKNEEFYSIPIEIRNKANKSVFSYYSCLSKIKNVIFNYNLIYINNIKHIDDKINSCIKTTKLHIYNYINNKLNNYFNLTKEEKLIMSNIISVLLYAKYNNSIIICPDLFKYISFIPKNMINTIIDRYNSSNSIKGKIMTDISVITP